MKIRKGFINQPCPPDWRQGQTMLNFIGWYTELYPKCVEIFYLEDEAFDYYWAEFIKHCENLMGK